MLQGGEDPQDALSLYVVFRKRALKSVANLRKETCNLKHPMHLRCPVAISVYVWTCIDARLCKKLRIFNPE